MKASVFSKLAPASPRAAGIAVAALAACGAALASTGAQAGGYSFEIINDPLDKPFPPPPAMGGVTFTNLMGITSNGDTIPGFFGSGQGPCTGCSTGDPNTGFVLTLPGKTFMPSNFPGFPQTQMTAVNGNGTTFTGYTYPTNNGTAVDNQFGFYEQNGKFTMVNNPQTPTSPPPGILIENQLIGVNNKDLAVGFYNSVGTDASGNHPVSHGYTFDIATKTFSANIDDPNASLTNGGTVAAAINNLGEIAGFFTDSAGVIHGFLFNSLTDTFSLPVDPPGATETELLGLNDNGIADGFAMINGFQHGILYNTLTKMFTILDPPGSTATTFNGLNDRGQIVGFFVDGTGNTDGVLGNPVPEPATWVMILAGFAGLGWLGLRGSRRPEVASAAS
jgi:hypothetical protein